MLITDYGTSAGTPAPALTPGMALRRSISAGCSTALEAGDDTNNSAADFSVTTPNPRPNSVAPSEMTCGVATPPGGNPTQPSGTGATQEAEVARHPRVSAGYPE